VLSSFIGRDQVTMTSGAEEPQRKIPKARVVTAFNTVPSEVLFGV
jgi:predicted dinucleotide-binding enzyme